MKLRLPQAQFYNLGTACFRIGHTLCPGVVIVADVVGI